MKSPKPIEKYKDDFGGFGRGCSMATMLNNQANFASLLRDYFHNFGK